MRKCKPEKIIKSKLVECDDTGIKINPVKKMKSHYRVIWIQLWCNFTNLPYKGNYVGKLKPENNLILIKVSRM